MAKYGVGECSTHQGVADRCGSHMYTNLVSCPISLGRLPVSDIPLYPLHHTKDGWRGCGWAEAARDWRYSKRTATGSR